MVEPTAVKMVDDLDAKMAARLVDELEQNSAVLMVEMMAALMVYEWAVWKDCSIVEPTAVTMIEPTAVTMVDDLDAKMAA